MVTKWGLLDLDEIHFTKNKWSIDVDVLIDDSPEKLDDFKKKVLWWKANMYETNLESRMSYSTYEY